MGQILVIDDEEQVCQVLSDLLGQHGHEVTTTTSGASAIDSLSDVQPDLVLLDMLMPDMGGIEVLGKIKEWNADVPVIILTGLEDEKIGQEAIEAGARDYITKPILGDQLETVLQVYLLFNEK